MRRLSLAAPCGLTHRAPCVALAALLALPALLPAGPAAAEPAAEAAEAKIVAALEEPAPAEFIETPLSDVAAFLAMKGGIPIIIDERALDDIGLDVAHPVTIQLRHVSLGSVLRHILRELDLTYDVRDEVLLITTPEESERSLQTRVVPVADLAGVGDRRAAEKLIDIVQATCQSNGWSEVGGPGTIRIYQGQLFVCQTRDVIQEVNDLLAALRNVAAAGEKVAAVPVGGVGESAVKIEAALRQRVSFEFVDTPLEEVARFLAAAHEIDVLIDRKSLDDVGIDWATPMSMQLKGVTLQSALRLLLRPHDLTYVVRDGLLLITTLEEVEAHLETVVYPVADLLADPQADGPAERAERLDALAEVLMETVRPNSWDEVGGPGALVPFARIDGLVCSQTREVHAEIALQLARLRKARAEGPPAGAAAPAVPEIRVFVLTPPPEGTDPVSAADLEDLVRKLVAPDRWQGPDVLLKALPGRLVVRHKPRMIAQVERRLAELGLIQQGLVIGGRAGGGGGFGGGGSGGGGGGFFSTP